jgi:hypothetical protein
MKRLKYILVLLVLGLSQSCMVYQKVPITLEEAYDKGNVQVVTNAGKAYEFRKIIIEDDIYYGVNRKSEISNIALDSKYISSIFLADKQKTILATTLLIIPFAVLLAISMANSEGIF